MRYNHFDMLPEKAFQPVGKRMTLEGGGGLGSVLGTAGSIAAGGNPIGAFGSTLAGQALQGGGGGGRGGSGGGMGSNVNGIGNQNQTQITGPYAGMNPASIAYKQMQQQQMQPQVQQPVGGVMVSGQLPPNVMQSIQNELGRAPAYQTQLPTQPVPFNEWMQSQNQDPNAPALTTQQLQIKYAQEMGMGGGGGGVFSDTNFPRPLPFKPIPPFAQPYLADLVNRTRSLPAQGTSTQSQGLGALMSQLQGGPQNFRGIR